MKQILSITSIHAILFNMWDHRENIDIGTMQSTVQQGFLDLLMTNLGLWSSDALSENSVVATSVSSPLLWQVIFLLVLFA